MSLVKIDAIEPGCVLAAEVKDRRGRLLMPAGATLQEGHIRSFKMWGITHVDVEGGDADAITELEPWAREAAEAKLADLFLHADLEHPFIAALHAHRLSAVALELQKNKAASGSTPDTAPGSDAPGAQAREATVG